MKSYLVDKKLVLATIKKYKDEILDQCDWWHGFEHHDINVFCLDDEPYDPDAVFHINIHTLGDNGMNDMFEEEQNMMQSMTREELRLL
jgi:hypothetical protein